MAGACHWRRWFDIKRTCLWYDVDAVRIKWKPTVTYTNQQINSTL